MAFSVRRGCMLACAGVAVAIFVAAAPAPAGAGTVTWPVLELKPVVSGLSQPLAVVDAGDNSGRLYVVEKTGVIRVIEAGQLLATPFLDIHTRVRTNSEQGLLGLAFSPDFAASGEFYIYYTHSLGTLVPSPPGEDDEGGDIVLARFRATADRRIADPASEERILLRNNPKPNHNGGNLLFGPDGYLYIGIGDGGGGGDPLNSGQRLDTLLGKILRIDVTGQSGYTIPPDNPFVATGGALPEIYAFGLRNPWRFSFDLETGALWIGDVGQDRYEEVNYRPAAGAAGTNFGWRIREGLHCYNAGTCTAAGLTGPVWEYDHETGVSITGGFVSRSHYPRMRGVYFYADFGTEKLWGLQWDGVQWVNHEFTGLPSGNWSSFGQGAGGELYLVDYGGTIYWLVDSVSNYTYNLFLATIQRP